MSLRIGVLLLSAALAQAQAPPHIQVRVSASRTAVWPGDRFEYLVTVEHGPEVQFVLDDLKKEDLHLPPFEVLDLRTSSQPLAGNIGRRLLKISLELVTFETGAQDLTIPSFNLHYFSGKAGSRGETQTEVLALPTFPVGLRSTLAGRSQALRDFPEEEAGPAARWMAPALFGLGGLAILGLWAALQASRILQLRAWRKQAAERRSRKKSLADSLEEIKRVPCDSREDLERFYTQAAELLRSLAAEKLGDGRGLTGREIEAGLLQAGADRPRAATLGALLDLCEQIRYAPNGWEQGRLERDELLRKLEELCASPG